MNVLIEILNMIGCVVVQANDMWLPEGTLFRLTEAQAWRINEALAAYNVDLTHVVPHA